MENIWISFFLGNFNIDLWFRLNFRVQKNTRTQKGSDFAEVAYYVLKNRCNEDVTMSIWEINKILDEIAVENGKGKEGQKVEWIDLIFGKKRFFLI